MPGSPFQKWEYREVAVGIGCHIHVEVVAEEIAFPVGIPAPVTVRLGIMAFAVTGSTAIFLTFAGAFFTLLCGSAHGRAIAVKSQVLRIDQTFMDGAVWELLLIKTEDQKKGCSVFS